MLKRNKTKSTRLVTKKQTKYLIGLLACMSGIAHTRTTSANLSGEPTVTSCSQRELGPNVLTEAAGEDGRETGER